MRKRLWLTALLPWMMHTPWGLAQQPMAEDDQPAVVTPVTPAPAPDGATEPGALPEGGPSPEAPVRVAAPYNEYGKRVVTVEEKPVPLLWAYGLTEPADLAPYKEAGFNTLWVPIPWSAELDWESTDALVDAAAAQDLWVILAVETGRPKPKKDEQPVRISTDDPTYRQYVHRWIDGVVKHYLDTPNLIAWAVQDDPGPLITEDDRAFRSHLQQRYGAVENLSQSWQVPVAKWEDVTLAQVPALDHGQPPYFGRPSLDLLLFRWRQFVDVHELWAHEIHTLDKDRLLLSGRLRDYKGLISVPPSYDGIIAETLPGLVENDRATHNAHSLDIARRGGLFCAFASLWCGQPGKAVDPKAVTQWLRAAAFHGAAGAGLIDWPTLKSSETLLAALKETWDELLAQDLLLRTPTPTTAILYEPTGEGAYQRGRALYGYGHQLSLNEPNGLIYSLSQGTRHGQLDYLGLDSLGSVNLERYGAILAPLALTLSPRAIAVLQQYASGGGAVVTDLGVGMAEAGGNMAALPEPLQQLLGVYGIERFVGGQRNMRVLVEHPLFPSLKVSQTTTGNLDGYAFSGALGRLRWWGDTLPYGLVYPGLRGAAGPGAVALTIHPYGRGYGVYAPFRLWSNWTIADQVWPAFHDDLLGRRANLTLQNSGGSLVPGSLQVAAFREMVAVFNAGRRATTAVLNTVGANNYLPSNCMATLFSANFPAPALFSRHFYERLGRTSLLKTVGAERSRLMRLYVAAQPGEVTACRFTPIRVEPDGESGTAQLLQYNRNGVRLHLYSQGSRVRTDRTGKLSVQASTPSTMRVALYSGDYEIKPNSEHVVTIVEDREGKQHSFTVFADDPPMLVFEERIRSAEVTIQPVGE